MRERIKKALVIDIAFPLNHNLPKIEAEKTTKCENLALEIKNMWKLKHLSIYHLVISAEGVVTKNSIYVCVCVCVCICTCTCMCVHVRKMGLIKFLWGVNINLMAVLVQFKGRLLIAVVGSNIANIFVVTFNLFC